MKLIVEIEQEEDGRWLADVPSAPGVMAYGRTRAEAAKIALTLLERILGERNVRPKKSRISVAISKAKR